MQNLFIPTLSNQVVPGGPVRQTSSTVVRELSVRYINNNSWAHTMRAVAVISFRLAGAASLQ